jgi:hypothetical protein
MRRSLGAVFGLVSGCVMAHAQHIVFTMRTHTSCPVVITSVSPSKEFGFDQVTLLDDSGKPIDSMELRVVLATDSREEVVDGGRVFAKLAPGERKSIPTFLGQIRALTQRAQELRQTEVRAIVYVESVEFSDGSEWAGTEPVVEIPVRPTQPTK